MAHQPIAPIRASIGAVPKLDVPFIFNSQSSRPVQYRVDPHADVSEEERTFVLKMLIKYLKSISEPYFEYHAIEFKFSGDIDEQTRKELYRRGISIPRARGDSGVINASLDKSRLVEPETYEFSESD